MTDLLGNELPAPAFKDIRAQRPSVAEEKAQLCAELNTMLRRTPPPSRIATIVTVRHFKDAHKTALKVLQSKSSSRQELLTQIERMRDWMGA